LEAIKRTVPEYDNEQGENHDTKRITLETTHAGEAGRIGGKRRSRLVSTGTFLVVADDDPTGTQTVHGIFVYMDWSVETLVRALSLEVPVFYISTNSRALGPAEARDLALELGRNLKKTAVMTGRSMVIASRSDSTLRGYFPLEVDALIEGLGEKIDGVILVPAFFEAGRYTINDTHWVDSGTECVRADQTEFAKDPVFVYRSHTLPEWVEEKTGGKWRSADVKSISLDTIRMKGMEGALSVLLSASKAVPVVVNATCYCEALGIATRY
jgi:uncharacterized protein YgbK (DUF1537 family)